MELDQLRYFLRVAEQQSYTRASEALGISQPALSRSIQKLEEELGQPVFDAALQHQVERSRQLHAMAYRDVQWLNPSTGAQHSANPLVAIP